MNCLKALSSHKTRQEVNLFSQNENATRSAEIDGAKERQNAQITGVLVVDHLRSGTKNWESMKDNT